MPAGRPPKKLIEHEPIKDIGEIFHRLRITQDYVQYICMIDVSDIVPYSAYRSLDSIFSKIPLIIKRQFGFLGYNWNYGAITEKRIGESIPIIEAPVFLHIYFQKPIDDKFLLENAEKFAKIVKYLRREWNIYKGSIEEEY